MSFLTHLLIPLALDAPSRGKWIRSQDYDVWTDCRSIDAPDLTLWERLDDKIVSVPDAPSLMHIIRGGTPFHISGLFGYWRACDSDLIWFRNVQAKQVNYVAVLGGSPEAYRKDVISWICPSCALVLSSTEAETGRKNPQRFWRFEEKAVEAFNAEDARRICPQCAHQHPPAYPFLRPDVARPAGELGAW